MPTSGRFGMRKVGRGSAPYRESSIGGSVFPMSAEARASFYLLPANSGYAAGTGALHPSLTLKERINERQPGERNGEATS